MEIAIKQNENGYRNGEKPEYQRDEETLSHSFFPLHRKIRPLNLYSLTVG